MKTLVVVLGLLLTHALAQVELEFQHSMNGPLGEAVTFMVDKYNEEKAGEVVVNETFVGSYEEGLQGALAQLAAGENPDILQLEVAMVARVAESGALMNWKPLFEGEYAQNYEDFFPVFRDQISREDGDIYAIPFNNSNPVLYYNVDILEQAGVRPPKTYTELPEIAAQIKETFPDVVPIYFDSFPWVLEGAVWSNGGEMVGEEGLLMNEPEAVEVIQLWTDVIRAGNAAPVTQTAQEDFAAGRVTMIFGSVASRFFIERAVGDNFAWQAAPLPYFDEPQVPVGGANLMIFDNISEEKKQAAIDFLVWITQPKQQFDWIRLTNYVPVNQKAPELPAFAEYLTSKPDLGIGIEQLPFSRPRPSRVGYPQATPEIVASLERIWLQNADVQTELDDLVARTARFFRE
jgi:sn-glycerol 3-phosphate transport system substrate-binding protein